MVRLSALVAVVAVVGPLLSAMDVAAASSSPRVGTVLAELKGSATISGDAVGVSVAISDGTALAGAPGYAKDVGLAYVFASTGSGWRQSAELRGTATVAGDFFGYSVAISGTTAVIGAPGYAKNAGRAYVFRNSSGTWRQAAVLKGSDTVSDDYFGDADSHIRHDDPCRCGRSWKKRWAKLRVQRGCDGLEAGRRAEGLRHCRRRRLWIHRLRLGNECHHRGA